MGAKKKIEEKLGGSNLKIKRGKGWCPGSGEYLQPSQELWICEAFAALLHQLPYSPAWSHASWCSYPVAACLSWILSLPELLSAAAALYEGGGGAEEEVRWVAVPLQQQQGQVFKEAMFCVLHSIVERYQTHPFNNDFDSTGLLH